MLLLIICGMDFLGGAVSFIFSKLISDYYSLRRSNFKSYVIQGGIGGGVAAFAALSAVLQRKYLAQSDDGSLFGI